MFQLQQFAAGRFDVCTENGMRAGSILGGDGHWCAEIGNRVIGYFPTQEQAAKAILVDRGIVGLYEQMARINESSGRLKQNFFDDFVVHDKRAIEEWGGATSMLWIVREHSTHLVALDLPLTKREGTATLRAMHPDLTGRPWDLYLVDADTLKVKSITEAQADELVQRPPKYAVGEDAIMSYGRKIAAVRRSFSFRNMAAGNRCNVLIECESEPSKQRLAILKRLAFYAASPDGSGGSFGAAAGICIRFETTTLYSWSPEQ